MKTTRTRSNRAGTPSARGGAGGRLAALLALGLALAACAPADPGDEAPAASAPGDEAPGMTGSDDGAAGAPAADDSPPADAPADDGPLAFTATDVNGAQVDVASLAGEPVVLWFWAPWCTICRGEAPFVADVAADLAGDVTFLGVAGLGPVEDMRGFVDDTGTEGIQHLVDDDGALWQRFGVATQPSYAFVSPDGSVDVRIGSLGSVELTERAEALIGT